MKTRDLFICFHWKSISNNIQRVMVFSFVWNSYIIININIV